MANIITLAEYRNFDDLPSPAENEDQVTDAITSATAFIEEKTGRVFELADNPSPNDVVETLDGNGSNRLYTRNAPITALSLLEYWDGTQWVTYDVTTYPRTFKAGTNTIYFTWSHKFYQGVQNIRATFEYGYTTAFPNNLKRACYTLAKFYVTEAERLGINRQADGEQSFWYNHDIPKHALETITRYKTVW